MAFGAASRKNLYLDRKGTENEWEPKRLKKLGDFLVGMGLIKENDVPEMSKIAEENLRELIRNTLVTEAPKKAQPSVFVTLLSNGINIVAEVANSPETRSRGLMCRLNLKDDSGMLFVFSESQERSFWMKETYIPLSIAYLNELGVILNIENMSPHNLSSVQSSGPTMYALEMNEGWFEKNGIGVGDMILGLPSLGLEL